LTIGCHKRRGLPNNEEGGNYVDGENPLETFGGDVIPVQLAALSGLRGNPGGVDDSGDVSES